MIAENDSVKGLILQDLGSSVKYPRVSIEKDDGTHVSFDNYNEDYEHSRRTPSLGSIGTIEEAAPDTHSKEPEARSRNSSTQSRRPVIPRSKRRGLLARFAVIAEIERPQEYSRKTKWLITLLVALAAAAAPMGSAIFYPALPEISSELQSTSTITNLSVAFYMLSMSIFPLWWSSFSETLGRRTIYIVSFTLCTIFSILSALSSSITMLIVMRVLSGGAAASVQAVGAGTIADIWETKERGRAMGIFYLGPLMGPLLAPIIGGALAQALGWRSTQWFLAIYGGCLTVILTFCLPETLLSINPATVLQSLPTTSGESTAEPDLTRVSTRQSLQQKAHTIGSVLKRCLIDPLLILAYLRFPAVALTVYYASITFGSLYVLNISIQQTFSTAPYNYSTLVVGLLYIPNSLGYVLSSLIGGRWSDKIMHREARAANRYDASGKLVFVPEDRMRENTYVAMFLYPAALIWYGWSVEKGVHWMVPMVANFFFGVGSMLIFSVSTTMLTEFMPKKSSSGVAVNNFVRNIFSCVGGIIASPLLDSIGNGSLFTGLGVIAFFSGCTVLAIRRWGPKWRDDMDKEMNK